MARQIVTYKPFDGRDGLAVEGDLALAYVDGAKVGSARMRTPVALETLLSSYAFPSLFPQAVFCHTQPETHQVVVDYQYTLERKREIHGWITFCGTRYRWWGTWRQMPKRSGVIPPDRPWLHADEIGKGLEFHLPPAISELPDPVIVRRLALALEGFIYALRDGFPVDLPFRYQFDNLFSLASPMWSGEGPAVTTAHESALLNRVERNR